MANKSTSTIGVKAELKNSLLQPLYAKTAWSETARQADANAWWL